MSLNPVFFELLGSFDLGLWGKRPLPSCRQGLWQVPGVAMWLVGARVSLSHLFANKLLLS